MFKILNFFKTKSGEIETLSMRARFEHAQEELNAVLADLGEMPSITVDAQNRRIDITAPDQFADEALALPAPEEKPQEAVEDSAAANDTEKDAESGAEKAVA